MNRPVYMPKERKQTNLNARSFKTSQNFNNTSFYSPGLNTLKEKHPTLFTKEHLPITEKEKKRLFYSYDDNKFLDRYNTKGRSPEEFAWKNYDNELKELNKNINLSKNYLNNLIDIYFKTRTQVWKGPAQEAYDLKIEEYQKYMKELFDGIGTIYEELYEANQVFKDTYKKTTDDIEKTLE